MTGQMSKTKRLVTTAICIALCVVLPIAFHSVPNAGRVFCPIHIPVLICGLACGPLFGALCGIIGAALCGLFTGMPAVPMLPQMMLELATYGLLSGIFINIIHTKKLYADLYISLLVAMLGGRIVSGLAAALYFKAGSYSLAAWGASYFVTSLPAIAIQLALIPSIVFALSKAGLTAKRS